MGRDAVRFSFWGDWENSDKDGNLIANDHLDVMDYAIAEAKKRGILDSNQKTRTLRDDAIVAIVGLAFLEGGNVRRAAIYGRDLTARRGASVTGSTIPNTPRFRNQRPDTWSC